MNAKEKLIREFVASIELQHKKEIPDMLRMAWLIAFPDIHIDRLSRTMVQYLATCKFFPQPGDIRDLAAELPIGPEELAEREAHALQCRERLNRRIEAGRQRQLEHDALQKTALPERSMPRLLPAAPAGMATTEIFKHASPADRLAELERQKDIVLKREAVMKLAIESGIDPHTAWQLALKCEPDDNPLSWTEDEWRRRVTAAKNLGTGGAEGLVM